MLGGKNWWSEFPRDLIRNFRTEGERSWKVSGDVNSQSAVETAFDEGRSFRIDYPFSIPDGGGPLVLKYTVSGSAVLTLSELSLDQGAVEYRVYAGAQATETSPFTGNLAIYPKNLAADTIATSNVTVEDGGAATFTGQQNTTLRIRTAAFAFNRETAVGGENTQRGFKDTTVYVEISQLAGSSTINTGILKQEWYNL